MPTCIGQKLPDGCFCFRSNNQAPLMPGTVFLDGLNDKGRNQSHVLEIVYTMTVNSWVGELIHTSKGIQSVGRQPLKQWYPNRVYMEIWITNFSISRGRMRGSRRAEERFESEDNKSH
jgi:hypothetical protein